ncbi:MAG: hypothetical protein IPM18_08000 [Phycisphaerales bacterium]|nr:hypothetical protein [Phycisphaerales bacterium]
MNQDLLLIGVDGGATEAKAHAATCDDFDRPASFTLRAEASGCVYPIIAGFVPVPVGEQLAQRDAGAIVLTAHEQEQGTAWIRATAGAVAAVAEQAGTDPQAALLIGIGMPGLKTSDGRGIAVINNGPRLPDYLRQLEGELTQRGLRLAAPIAALGSDADYCGLGEEHAGEGLFRDVAHAYYVGGGTGVADALKLHGGLVPMDQARTWLQKSWQLTSALGPTFERLISAKSLNAVHANLYGGVGAANREFPERAALAGDPVARATLHTAALVLAELLAERILTIFRGRIAATHRGDAYARLAEEHPFRGTVLERIIIGQRIGVLYAWSELRPYFAAPLEACLAALLRTAQEPAITAAVLTGTGALRPGFLVSSQLRAAPALGAAIAAVQARVRSRAEAGAKGGAAR